MIVADDLTIEIAPGADLDADPSTWTWVDITTRVRTRDGVDITGMGRGGESADADTPSLTIRVENEGGDFSSRNPLGEWYPDLGVGTPIRVYWDTDANIRFAGHISELPPRWIGDEAGSDEVALIRADGFTRRLTQGEQALDSPLFRALSTHDNVVAYWPCEDGRDADEAASPLDGVNPFTPSGVTFGESAEQSDSVLFGASSVMRIDDPARNVLGRVPNHTPDDVYVVELAWLMPETATAARAIMDVRTTSPDLARWQIRASSTEFQVRAWDSDDTNVLDNTETISDALWGQWVRAELLLNGTTAGQVGYRARLFTATQSPTIGAGDTLLNSRTGVHGGGVEMGRITRAGVNGPTMAQERYAGHITVLTGTADELPNVVGDSNNVSKERNEPFHGYTGELAVDRFERLCDEEGLTCSITAPTGGLRVPGDESAGSNASTPDAAAHDITGDIDVRAWVAPLFWTKLSPAFVATTAGKWDETADERSWRLQFETVSGEAFVQFQWTTDGTAGTISTVDDGQLVPTPPDGEFAAIRVALDVDNGSSEHVVTFYRGASLDGPWTEFYSETIAGTTSIHSGSADLVVGRDDDGNTDFDGDVREVRVYDGIDGTLVASPDFTAQEIGDTSFDDAQGNTWTLNGDAAIVRADDSMPMGPQQIDTLTALLQEIETADAGILSEADFGFVYRTLTALYNQSAALTLSQPDGELAFPPEPTDDDRHVRNDITASSPFGTSVRAVDDDHITDHGRFADPVTGNPETVDQLRQSAYWQLHLGTVDEYRWPRIDIALHADPDLIDDWLAVRVGDRLTVDHDIAQLTGVDIDLIVAGWDERFDQFNWDVALNCVPASPYTVAVFDTSRFDTAGSSLDENITDSATSFDVASDGQPWVNSTDHSSEFPFDIEVGGEVMTVTAISGDTSPQTFTVTRSVNDVDKAHSDGDAVRLATRPVFAL